MKKLMMLLLTALCVLTLSAASAEVTAAAPFVPEGIVLDGEMDAVWEKAEAIPLENLFSVEVVAGFWGPSNVFTPAEAIPDSATVRALWDGSAIYFLVEVTDTTPCPGTGNGTNVDSVLIAIDALNDKNNLTNEDDGIYRIPINGEAPYMNHGVPQINRFGGSAVKITDSGYIVEAAVYISDLGFKGGEAFGFDVVVYGAADDTLCNAALLSSTADISENMTGGFATLNLAIPTAEEWDARGIDWYVLNSLIAEAEGLPRGIWADEAALDAALTAAKAVSADADRAAVDAAAQALENAIDGMRHVDPVRGLPDPKDITPTKNLPDPYTFLDGTEVTKENWSLRAEEIIYMGQYYEWGIMPEDPDEVTAVWMPETNTITITVTDNGKTVSFNAYLVLPAEGKDYFVDGKFPLMMTIDWGWWTFGWGLLDDPVYSSQGYAQVKFTYTDVAADALIPSGIFYELYPHDASQYGDRGTSIAWAWGASRVLDALEYLDKNDPNLAGKLDLSRIGVTGSSRLGKTALVAGMLDERFGVTIPMQSGSGGAGTYRYVPFYTQYSWAAAPSAGTEVLPHRVRNQPHNHNLMLRYFMDDRWFGANWPDDILGTRLPYDKNLICAAFAPRGLYIVCSNNDDANNPYGDSISYEGAKLVYEWLGAADNIALDVSMENVGHATSASQYTRMVEWMNRYFYGIPLSAETEAALNYNPFLSEGGYDRYGGLETMLENYSK